MDIHDNINWNEYFMGLAILSSKRSKDPNTKVGACIVNQENKIVGIGYNGFPKKCYDNTLPWTRDDPNPLNNKYMYVIHAEVNAILNSNTRDLKDCRLYVTLFPCNECAKIIIQCGINEVIYLRKPIDERYKTSFDATERMFSLAGIGYRLYKNGLKKLELSYE